MPLKEIVASFECDKCGKPFKVGLDPAYEPPSDWSLFDVAEDAVRGSLDYQGPDRPGTGYQGISSVQDGKLLCGACT